MLSMVALLFLLFSLCMVGACEKLVSIVHVVLGDV